MHEFIVKNGKALFWVIGLFIPIIVILVQLFAGWDNTPLNIVMFTWFGVALFIYLGVYEEDEK